MQAGEFLNYKNWVVVGDVSNPSKYAYRILNALKAADFNAEGVNPRDTTGNLYKSLKEVSYKIDVIDLCINPITGLKVMQEAKDLNISKVLIQPGAESQEILDFCRNNGIIAVEGCALVELAR
ncbi:CoA-binding protein [Clostridium sp. SYSU_GA19001]|uniref:CoA-binding protein n=1 Tax=Clostridium caldaquaticum TaxID=2940653 RepID=UPI002076EC73|nr:CoA-binding protein [Clostridium caldaquaticum]MCM8711565.1 CoA-binding protein [Clostridium caldaquaticum]